MTQPAKPPPSATQAQPLQAQAWRVAPDPDRLWQRLAPDRWPIPRGAFPAEAALVGGAVRDGLLDRLAERPTWIWSYRRTRSASAGAWPSSTAAAPWCSTRSGTSPGWCWAAGAST
jgi:hypothetical protein